MEILEADVARRARGGSVEDLIADLPRILTDGGTRSSAPNARLAQPDVAIVDLHWPDGREQLVVDETLANLPALGESEVAEVLGRLREFERELSGLRRRLHGVIGGLEREIATRAVGAVE